MAMKATEIFHHFSDETASGIFNHLYENDKPAYRAALQVLANRRKLRPVLLDRKPRTERHAWMRNELARSVNEDASTEILQAWVLGTHQAMVVQFLDELSVPHDGRGLLDTLPAEPPADKIRAAIDGLFAKHPKDAVFAYLHLFAAMDITEWPSLQQIITEDSRLCPTPQTLAA
jgi:hypothetical protein